MTTLISTTDAASEAVADPWVVMRAVGWKGYTAVLRVRGDRRHPKMVYLDGDLYLTSPELRHDYLAEQLGDFVKVVAEELDIIYVKTRSTTFRSRKKQGGVEADHSFYLANAARIAGKTKLHLRVDPPPDLVIEAVNTHGADESVEVWRRFGVPEVWVCDAESLVILVLQPGGTYASAESSASFPFLTRAEIFEWAGRPQSGDDLAWMKALRRWVRETVVPRVRPQAPEPNP